MQQLKRLYFDLGSLLIHLKDGSMVVQKGMEVSEVSERIEIINSSDSTRPTEISFIVFHDLLDLFPANYYYIKSHTLNFQYSIILSNR